MSGIEALSDELIYNVKIVLQRDGVDTVTKICLEYGNKGIEKSYPEQWIRGGRKRADQVYIVTWHAYLVVEDSISRLQNRALGRVQNDEAIQRHILK